MRAFFLLVLLAGALDGADGQLHLKSKRMETVRDLKAYQAEPLKRKALSRSHVLVHFDEAPGTGQIRELERRGARLLRYIPDHGFMVSIEDGTDLDGLGLRWAGRLRQRDKISALVQSADIPPQSAHFIAEFHPDVPLEQARELSAEHGYQVLEHPDLLPNQLLIRGFAVHLPELVEWDEVSYIFPASEDLAEGNRVEACAGAVTTLGLVAQYATRISEGWDGAGKRSAELGYFFESLTEKLPQDKAREEILRAMREWARYASLGFFPAAGPASPRTLNILFASRNHGDPYPFDGRSKVLAHTFYPAPPNPEPIAGDIHLDDDEEWVAGPDLTVYSVDLFTVALHELGHALGLGHSDRPGTVMYPYYRRATNLAQQDIDDIQELYAAPPSAPGDGPADNNPVEPTPAAPLSLLIQTPAVFPFITTKASFSISGTVTGGVGEIQVAWVNDRGAGGVAQGGRNWSVPGLPLQLGDNIVTITATDEARKQASRSVTITRRSEEKTPGNGPDAVAPSLKILSPALTNVLTYSSTISLQGTATDNVAVAEVTWSTSTGKSGVASGTSSWITGEIPLLVGTNRIVVRAVDAAGNSGWRSVTVTRR